MKKAWIRIAGIGILHLFLYTYLVPFVIYPKFGDSGLKFVVAVAVLISVAVFGTIWIEKKSKKKGDKNG